MKKVSKLLFFFFGLALFTSCGTSNYAKYWHGEEDDVYFTSATPEGLVPTVEVYEDRNDDRVNDGLWRSDFPDRRTYDRDYNYNRRYRNRNHYPVVIRSNRGSDNDNTSRPSPKKAPTPTRPSRPNPSQGSSPQ